MTTTVALVAATGAVAVVSATIVVRWFIVRRTAARNPLPPIFFPMSVPGTEVGPQANAMPQFTAPRHANGAVHSNGTPATQVAVRSPFTTPLTPATPASALPHVETQVRRPVADDRPPAPARRAALPEERYRDAETIRFLRPNEQPLQFLPGHLEVLEGAARDREIRFVRVPGEVPQIILCREAGPSPNMVGLGSATVSRMHARMDYADGQWHVKNLSHTNPVVVNDEELTDADAPRPLVDGDRLELGEVVLRFHAH